MRLITLLLLAACTNCYGQTALLYAKFDSREGFGIYKLQANKLEMLVPQSKIYGNSGVVKATMKKLVPLAEDRAGRVVYIDGSGPSTTLNWFGSTAKTRELSFNLSSMNNISAVRATETTAAVCANGALYEINLSDGASRCLSPGKIDYVGASPTTSSVFWLKAGTMIDNGIVTHRFGDLPAYNAVVPWPNESFLVQSGLKVEHRLGSKTVTIADDAYMLTGLSGVSAWFVVGANWEVKLFAVDPKSGKQFIAQGFVGVIVPQCTE